MPSPSLSPAYAMAVTAVLLVAVSCCASRRDVEAEVSLDVSSMRHYDLATDISWLVDDTICHFAPGVEPASQYPAVTVRHLSARRQATALIAVADTVATAAHSAARSQAATYSALPGNVCNLTPFTTAIILGFIILFILIMVHLLNDRIG